MSVSEVKPSQKRIMTVEGEIPSATFGPALVHEHVLVDFAGARRISRDRYDPEDVIRVIGPHLERVRDLGLKSFVECTPMYLGRDAALLKRLARTTGLQILTNTGIYAAGEKDGQLEPYVPDYGFALSAEELAGGWLKEWFEGIEGTGVRPGFIKTGVNPGPLRPTSQKVVRAAAMTSRRTGLAIACHAVKAVATLQCLDILEQEKVSPTRFIYVHAQGEENLELLAQCARRGAWIEFDGVNRDSVQKHLQAIRAMLDKGFESQILISQDAGWYRPGEPGGGSIRPFDFLFTDFIPSLFREGVPRATIDHFLEHNPRQAFSIAPHG